MQNIYYNITGEQTLVWDAPEGRPSSVTSVTVYPSGTGDDGTAEAATTGVGAVETNPNTTFDANSGAGQADPTLLNLAATTGIAVGRNYLATNAAGESEMVDVVGFVAGASASSRHNLENAYASADTFASTRISISIDDTWVADSSNISDDSDPNPGYRIRWVYVVDSITRVHDDYFNLVRYKASHDVTPLGMANKRSTWINNLPVEHQEDRGMVLIDDAYDDFRFDLHRRRIPSEMLRNRDVVNQMTKLRALMNSSKEVAVRTGDVTGYEIDRDEYFGALDGLIPDKTSIATDTSGAGGTVAALSIWER